MKHSDSIAAYTASNLVGNVFLKICKANLRLLIESELLVIIENLIGGKLFSLYAEKTKKLTKNSVSPLIHEKVL